MVTLLIGIALGIVLTLCGFVVRTHGAAWRALVFDERPAVANFRVDLTINGQDYSYVTAGEEGRFSMKIQQRDGRVYAAPPWEVSGFATTDGELTFSVGRGRLNGGDPVYFKRKTRR